MQAFPFSQSKRLLISEEIAIEQEKSGASNLLVGLSEQHQKTKGWSFSINEGRHKIDYKPGPGHYNIDRGFNASTQAG